MSALRAAFATLAVAVHPIPGIATAQGAAGTTRLPYRDSKLPVERRVDDLLARMTLEEKVAQMLSFWQQGKGTITAPDGRFDPARAPHWFRVGLGRIERPSAGHGA